MVSCSIHRFNFLPGLSHYVWDLEFYGVLCISTCSSLRLHVFQRLSGGGSKFCQQLPTNMVCVKLGAVWQQLLEISKTWKKSSYFHSKLVTTYWKPGSRSSNLIWLSHLQSFEILQLWLFSFIWWRRCQKWNKLVNVDMKLQYKMTGTNSGYDQLLLQKKKKWCHSSFFRNTGNPFTEISKPFNTNA